MGTCLPRPKLLTARGRPEGREPQQWPTRFKSLRTRHINGSRPRSGKYRKNRFQINVDYRCVHRFCRFKSDCPHHQTHTHTFKCPNDDGLTKESKQNQDFSWPQIPWLRIRFHCSSPHPSCLFGSSQCNLGSPCFHKIQRYSSQTCHRPSSSQEDPS